MSVFEAVQERMKPAYFEIFLDKNGTKTEEEKWSDFSFAQAMRGLEDDDMPDTDADLKERWLPSPTAINI